MRDYMNMDYCFYLSSFWVQNANTTSVEIPPYPKFKGVDTIVIIVGPSVDYLDEQFIDDNGNTRIIGILDQDISLEHMYDEESINTAIKEFKNGKNPYTVVPHYPRNDYGTDICKVIGGKIDGLLEDNKFMIFKLKEAFKGCYKEERLISALQYIYEFKKNIDKPIVVYIPLETSAKNKESMGPIKEEISKLSQLKGTAIVTTTGGIGEIGNTNSTASPLSEYEDVISIIPYSLSENSAVYGAGKIDMLDFKTLSPFAIADRGYVITYDNDKYIVNGMAVVGAIGAALTAAILQWAISDGKKPDIYYRDIRTNLIKSTNGDYINGVGYGVVDIDRLKGLLM